jgi:TPR repeat protein
MRRVLSIIDFSLILFLLTASACPAFSQDIKALIDKAKGGDAKAQFDLGVAYSEGVRVPKDDHEAAKWMRKAADQGFARAQHSLGDAYFLGKGVSQDHKEAMKWYRKAGERGDAGAQLILCTAYFIGEGVPEDASLSYFWCSLAASKSVGARSDDAVHRMEKAAELLTPEQLSKAQRMVREWGAKHPGER